jgi:tetratricopeptide (TPR) repeat protein
MLLKRKLTIFLLTGILCLPDLVKGQASVAPAATQRPAATGTAIVENYTEVEMRANVAFTIGKLDEARRLYQEALKLQPGATWPALQLSKIEAQRLEDAKKHYEGLCNACYARHRTTADSALSKKAYTLAHTEYTRALQYKRNDNYAAAQIARIEKLEQDAQYRLFIKRGREALASSSFPEATSAFEPALKLRANDADARKGLAEIAGKSRQKFRNEQPANEDVARLAEYKDTLAVADELFKATAYQAARNTYQKARELNPGEQYPRRKIQEIDSLFAARKQELETRKKNADKESLYTATTDKADKAFEAGDLRKARSLYEAAQQLRTGDNYATEKISAIDGMLLEEEARRRSAASEKIKVASEISRYNDLLAKGNAALAEKRYEAAKEYFISALAINASEASLHSQLDLVEKKLDLERIEARYKYFIHTADNLAFKTKDKLRALNYYDSAHALKPGEGYAKTQIILLNDQLARSSAGTPQQQNKGERSEKFNEAFKVYRKADEARIEKKFTEAYTGFNSFLNQLDIANPGLYQIDELYYINQAKDYIQQLESYKPQAVESIKETPQEDRRRRLNIKNDK